MIPKMCLCKKPKLSLLIVVIAVCFMLTLDDVHMAAFAGSWTTGNGESAWANWVDNKDQYFIVEKRGDQYVLAKTGTGL